MCGLIWTYTAKGRASKLAFARYQEQNKRGKEGYGAVCVNQRVVDRVYRSEDENGIKGILSNKSNMVLLHHRKPTSTPNYVECTHPIFVSNDLLVYNYYVIHNGMISNAAELRIKYNKLGFEYTTEVEEMHKTKGKVYKSKSIKFNDSESFAIDLAIAIEGGNKKLDSSGSIAFIALQVNKETGVVESVFYGRNNTNPLVVEKIGGNIIIASEGKGIEVPAHKLVCYDPVSMETTTTDLEIGYKAPPATDYKPYQPSLPPPREQHSEDRQPSLLDNLSFARDSHRRHNATHDIMSARLARHDKHLTRRQQKAAKRETTTHFCQVSDKYGRVDEIEYTIKGDYLLYTTIYKDDILRQMRWFQWDWYSRIVKEKEELEDTITKNKKNKFFNKEPIVRKLQECARQFELLSDTINRWASEDAQNRIIMDRGNELISKYSREALEEKEAVEN